MGSNPIARLSPSVAQTGRAAVLKRLLRFSLSNPTKIRTTQLSLGAVTERLLR